MSERCECQSCDWEGPISDADACRDIWSRLEAGDESPAGDCPVCGAFAMLAKTAPTAQPLPPLIDRLKALIAEGLDFSTMVRAFADHQFQTEPELALYFRSAGSLSFVREGQCEIDRQGSFGAGIVSKGDDDGAYVLAWVWVTDAEAGVDVDDGEEV